MYTAPNGDDADFNFVAAYTAPAGDGADFNFTDASGGPFPYYIRSALRGGFYLPRGF